MTQNHVTHHPCHFSEHKMIGPQTMRQSYAWAMKSFGTAQQTAVSCRIILAVRSALTFSHKAE